jgi:uncharacterized protein
MPLFVDRPARDARRIRVPLLVVVAQQDQSVLAKPAIRVAARVANATLVQVPGGHYAPFLEQHEAVVEAGRAQRRRAVGPAELGGSGPQSLMGAAGLV